MLHLNLLALSSVEWCRRKRGKKCLSLSNIANNRHDMARLIARERITSRRKLIGEKRKKKGFFSFFYRFVTLAIAIVAFSQWHELWFETQINFDILFLRRSVGKDCCTSKSHIPGRHITKSWKMFFESCNIICDHFNLEGFWDRQFFIIKSSEEFWLDTKSHQETIRMQFQDEIHHHSVLRCSKVSEFESRVKINKQKGSQINSSLKRALEINWKCSSKHERSIFVRSTSRVELRAKKNEVSHVVDSTYRQLLNIWFMVLFPRDNKHKYKRSQMKKVIS